MIKEKTSFLNTKNIITGIVFILLIIANFINCKAFSLEYVNLYMYVFITSIFYILLSWFMLANFSTEISKKGMYIALSNIVVILIAITISSTVVNSKAYYNVLKIEENKELKEILEEKEIRTISRDMAFKSANKIMGITLNNVILSSQYSIDSEEASLQRINGELVWVFPLDYMGFFKWLNQNSIPGYITVSATNNEEPAKFIQKEFKLGYNGFFHDKAERKVWFESGLKSIETHFEIDEEGNPYYIGLIKSPTILFGAKEIKEAVLVNAKTGVSEKLSVEDMHKKYKWIDTLISENLSLEQIKNKGLYGEGWFNSVFNQNNVKKPTDEYLTTISVGGQLWSFTGITSLSSKDQSLIEGIFVNNITGKASVLPLSEITNEDGAIQQMESSLGSDSIKWKVILPQPLIIDGEFYWLGTVVSTANLYQKVMAINGKNVAKVYDAKDVESLIKKIKNVTEANNTEVNNEETVVIKKSVLNKLLKISADLEEIKKELNIQ